MARRVLRGCPVELFGRDQGHELGALLPGVRILRRDARFGFHAVGQGSRSGRAIAQPADAAVQLVHKPARRPQT